ncbi:MAG: NlpC/P60 family protein [Pseudomonadota bacterium]|nr:NlpC/P60 family protein [Pseudomonadota bacterium]
MSPPNRNSLPDPRRHPLRDDVAARYLEGRIGPRRFADPVRRRVARTTLAMRRTPDAGAMQVSELLLGEDVDVYEEHAGWCWVQGTLDGYVGYVEATGLSEPDAAPDHRVSARLSHVFPAPDIKLPPLTHLTLGARIRVLERNGRFARVDAGGWMIESHLRAIDRPEDDLVTVALRALDAPYLWGGRSTLGLDCSGLVQVSAQALGVDCPRDSDMQAAELGTACPVPESWNNLRRGQVVYIPGHCMIADGAGGLVHANATHMMVTHEPASVVFGRTGGGWGAVRAVRAPRS